MRAAILLLLSLVSLASCYYRTYDYIIAGGGTAGSVLAGRLSENPNISVLLLERGQNVTDDPTTFTPNINSVLPAFDSSILPTEHLHSYEPGLSSGQTPTFLPFALGGGPAVSGSFWGRGDPSNYAEWATLVGDNRLRYENLLPYFKRSENVDPTQSNSTERGRTGPIQISILDYNDTNIAPYVTSHAAAFNLTYGRDYCTSYGVNGVWPMQRSIVRDPLVCNATHGPCTRSTSFSAYVEPHLNRPNLEVIPEANVLALTWKRSSTPSVSGVRFLLDGEVIHARASKEVILSLGTFGSPKLMMLSGIGNSDNLQGVGIDVAKNLPGVGQNLRDHAYLTLAYYLPTAPTISAPSSVRISFLKSGYNGNFSDIELAWGMVPTSQLLPAGYPGAIMLVRDVQVRNAALGNITLRSRNPFERVDATFGFTMDKLQPLIWAFKKIRTWMTASGGVELSPGSATLALNATDSTIAAYVSKSVAGWFHMAGTCKMGSSSDPLAVVDSNFKVFGVQNLRVVDNSVQPVEVCIHPSATAVVLAEVAADRILADYCD